ncbi:MAG TPA: aldo/keto reductase [Fimbriimonadaceae bacterium]|nr:aldo/keto reductase [Fimbriimonadaceae bacterium]
MNQRKLGNDSVGEIGLGCMGMSWAYGPGDEAESLRVLDRALELGVNHWDTADMYGAGENEKLLAKSLPGKRERVFLATKFGNVFDSALSSHTDLAATGGGMFVDGTPAYAAKCLDNSLKRLGVDHVDLYYLHRVDPRVPIEETVGAMAEFIAAGKTRHIGLSEASADTIRRAHRVHPIAAVQSEFSLWTRDYAEDVVPMCAELGITFVPYSPLGRGFLTGEIKTLDDLPEGDWRRSNPRFQGENFVKNLEIVALVEQIAKKHDAAPSQVALAWVLAQGKHLVPIPGTKRVKYLESNAAAANLTLAPDELEALSAVAPPAGDRYPKQHMSRINL